MRCKVRYEKIWPRCKQQENTKGSRSKSTSKQCSRMYSSIIGSLTLRDAIDGLKYIETANLLVPTQHTKPDLVFISAECLYMRTNTHRSRPSRFPRACGSSCRPAHVITINVCSFSCSTTIRFPANTTTDRYHKEKAKD